MRLVHQNTGVVIDVPEEFARRLEASWRPEVAKRTTTARKK